MNKDLYGNKFSLPEEVVSYLQQCHDAAGGADESVEGYKRNKELRDSREVTYQQLKRMKNWFDKFEGNENDLSYILNGGHYVKNWVHNTLTSMRDNVHNTKKNKSEVLPNQFIQPHEKNDMTTINRPSKSHKSTVDKYDTAIMENLTRINDLIKKII
jgi:hypothetical protein